MIRTFLEFSVRPGKAADLVAFFEREAFLSTSVAQDGCHSAELTMSDDGLTALVTATWDDRAAYDRWVQRPDREATGAELSELLTSPVGGQTVGKVFDVVSTGAVEQ